MRILELENRCTGNRTVGSNPTLSANFLAVDVVGPWHIANALQAFHSGAKGLSKVRIESVSGHVRVGKPQVR